METVGWCLIKLNILLPYDPSIMLPDIYLMELKTHVYTNTWKFMAALFTTANIWKQARCPFTGERTNKLWYIQTMDYYSALKSNKPSNHEKTWRKLNKRSQSEKAIYCMVSSIWHSEKGKTMERVKRSVAARGWGEMWQGEGWTGENSPEDFQGSKHILHDTLKMDTCHYTFIQTHRMWKTNMTQNISPGLWVIMTPM